MGRRFVFVEEVQDILSQGQTEMELPEGTRFSPAANDLIREKGIRVSFTGSSLPDGGKAESPGGEHDVVPRDVAGTLIAVASGGKTVADTVGNVAARSPYFLLFNSQGELVEALDNPYCDVGGGAGPLVAELMAGKGIKTLIAGNFGVNLIASLKEKRVNYLVSSGTVGEVVKSVLAKDS